MIAELAFYRNPYSGFKYWFPPALEIPSNDNHAVPGAVFIRLVFFTVWISMPYAVNYELVFMSPAGKLHHRLENTVAVTVRHSVLLRIPVVERTGHEHPASRSCAILKINGLLIFLE